MLVNLRDIEEDERNVNFQIFSLQNIKQSMIDPEQQFVVIGSSWRLVIHTTHLVMFHLAHFVVCSTSTFVNSKPRSIVVFLMGKFRTAIWAKASVNLGEVWRLV